MVGRRSGTSKFPLSSVVARRASTFVATSVTTTVALTTTAPEGSLTVPRKVALSVWANNAPTNRKNSMNGETLSRIFCIPRCLTEQDPEDETTCTTASNRLQLIKTFLSVNTDGTLGQTRLRSRRLGGGGRRRRGLFGCGGG